MAELRTLMSGLVLGEQPRWHEGRLWFSDWGTQEVIAVDLDGNSQVSLRGLSFPLCVDWLPDGRLLVVSARDGLLLRREHGGSLVTYGDLKTASDPPAVNKLVVDTRGNAYVNGGGFNMMAGEEFAPGVIALVAPDGSARQVADGLAFPNGMLVMPGSSPLIVAESYAKRLTAFGIDADGGLSNRRVWADLDDGVPDSICADAENAVWYADVPNKRCVRVREGGQVLEPIDLDRGCFACALGGTSGTTLFMLAQEWSGPQNMFKGPRSGLVLTTEAPAPRAGWPQHPGPSGSRTRTTTAAATAKLRPGYANFALDDPPLTLVLNYPGKGPGGTINHMGVEVSSTGDVTQAEARLTAAGLPVEAEPGAACCYARQDKVGATDPDGVAWEYYTVLEHIETP